MQRKITKPKEVCMRQAIFLATILVLLIFTISFAQEQLTITTYYPSPYGSYNELQLSPHTPAVTNCNSLNAVGTIYYDSIAGSVQLCTPNGTGGFWWTGIGGGGGPAPASTVIYTNQDPAAGVSPGHVIRCDTGDLATGGGISVLGVTTYHVTSSMPDGSDGWYCAGFDNGGGAAVTVCYVRCLDLPPAH